MITATIADVWPEVYPWLVRYAKRRVGNQTVAEDVASAAILRHGDKGWNRCPGTRGEPAETTP